MDGVDCVSNDYVNIHYYYSRPSGFNEGSYCSLLGAWYPMAQLLQSLQASKDRLKKKNVASYIIVEVALLLTISHNKMDQN